MLKIRKIERIANNPPNDLAQWLAEHGVKPSKTFGKKERKKEAHRQTRKTDFV